MCVQQIKMINILLSMKPKIPELVFIFFVFLLIISVSCKSFGLREETTSLPSKITRSDASFRQEREIIEGNILEKANTEWGPISIKKNTVFSVIYFLNENVGWACNRNFVFKTIDSAKSWQSFPINFVENAEIESIHFTNELQGWLILQDGEAYSEKAQVRIYRTTDGGGTWSLFHLEKSISFRDVYFSENDIWIVGTRAVNPDKRSSNQTIIYYSGKTSEWRDISESFGKLIYDSRYAEGYAPGFGGITVSPDNCVVVVNQVEKIFRSCDNGKTWELINNIGNTKRPEDYYTKYIEVKGDFMWILQSINAIDSGTSTLLTLISANPDEKKKVFSLPNYFSSQAYSISSEEFFLVGKKGSFIEDPNADKGLILHTKDGGKTWNSIFRATEEIKFAQFLPTNPIYIWVLTDKGDLYKLSKI